MTLTKIFYTMKRFLCSSITALFAFILMISVMSCSRDNEVSPVYTAKLEMTHTGDFINGKVFYKNEKGELVSIIANDVFVSGETKTVSFNVSKGFASQININLVDLYGNFIIKWTISDQNGKIYQIWDRKISRTGGNAKDLYEEIFN